MKRSSFINTGLITGIAATLLPAVTKASANEPAPDRSGSQYYELKVYSLLDATQQQLTEDYLKNALIPALRKTGLGPVGVFTEINPAGQTKIYVLVTYSSADQVFVVSGKLEKDSLYQEAGKAYLNAPVTAPAFVHIESSLLKAFAHMPKMNVPASSSRIFELRQYQSASEAAGKKKIEMFNDQGEIDIFVRLGFRPVFFSETVIGPLRPNLTYMITFDDQAAHDAHWKSFGADAQWKKISSVPEYADALLVSKITSTMLKPADYSQI